MHFHACLRAFEKQKKMDIFFAAASTSPRLNFWALFFFVCVVLSVCTVGCLELPTSVLVRNLKMSMRVGAVDGANKKVRYNEIKRERLLKM